MAFAFRQKKPAGFNAPQPPAKSIRISHTARFFADFK